MISELNHFVDSSRIACSSSSGEFALLRRLTVVLLDSRTAVRLVNDEAILETSLALLRSSLVELLNY